MKHELLAIRIYIDDETDLFTAVSQEPPCEVESSSPAEAVAELARLVREWFDEAAEELNT